MKTIHEGSMIKMNSDKMRDSIRKLLSNYKRPTVVLVHIDDYDKMTSAGIDTEAHDEFYLRGCIIRPSQACFPGSVHIWDEDEDRFSLNFYTPVIFLDPKGA